MIVSLNRKTTLLVIAVLVRFFLFLTELAFEAGAALGRHYYANKTQYDRAGRIAVASAKFAGKVSLVALELAFVAACHAAHFVRVQAHSFVITQMGDLAADWEAPKAVETVANEYEAYASAPIVQAVSLVFWTGRYSNFAVIKTAEATSKKVAALVETVYVSTVLTVDYVAAVAKEWARKAREIAAIVTK